MNYPNRYYEELASIVIPNPTLQIKNGEVCFYQGEAQTFTQKTKEEKGKTSTKTSLIITPWFGGVKRTKQTPVSQVTKTNYYPGRFYITNMRLVFFSQVNSFDFALDRNVRIKQYSNGISVSSGRKSYSIVTNDVKYILYVIDLLNKAQSTPSTVAPTPPLPVTDITQHIVSRNDDYAIAAFIHYCENGGNPVNDNDCYPSYFRYDFHVNNPSKYHQKVVDEGYLSVAPVSVSLKRLKVDELKQILISNGLSEKGKKDVLVQRIVDEVDTSSLKLEKIYVPSEKGLEHLRKYDFLFKVKKYDISTDEYEAQQRKQTGPCTADEIIWQLLCRKFAEHNNAGDFGLARDDLYNKALFLSDKEKQKDALLQYILVLFYDMSGCTNGGHIESKADLFLAPYITKEIFDRKEFYSSEMVDICYNQFYLPHHYFNKGSFEKLLKMISDDETIDLLNI